MKYAWTWRDLFPDRGNTQSFYIQTLWAWSDLALPCLTLWTIALSLLWLRAPREPFRTVRRYPGAVACAAVIGSFALNLVFDLIFYVVLSCLPGENGGWYLRFLDLLSHIQDDFSRYARVRGDAIAICWLFLWASGQWRAQATWLDRLSRAVAILWLVATVPSYWFSSDPPGPLM
jgi:hypothetical protein